MLLLGQSHLASWLSSPDVRLWFVNIPHFLLVLEMPLARCGGARSVQLGCYFVMAQ